MLSVVAGGLSGATYRAFFAAGGPNNDEVAYRLQAAALRHGHLFLQLPQPARAYQPWFFALTGHGGVGKYALPIPGLLAGGELFGGSPMPTLIAVAAALPPIVYLLARSLQLSQAAGLLAAAVFSLSPLTVVQSGQVLAYLPTLALLLLAWAGSAYFARTGSFRWLTLAVATGGLAFWARPWDAVLLLAPAFALVAWSLARTHRARLWPAIGVGGLALSPTIAAALLYNRAATGSITRSPFNLLQPADRLGFGVRKLYPEDAAHHFGPLQGLYGLAVHFGSAALLWSPAAAMLLLALLVRRSGRSGAPWPWPQRLFATAAGLYVLGYFPFWGPWNSSVLWGGPTTLGPMYALPTLVVVVMFGVPPAIRALQVSADAGLRRVALVIAVGAVAVNGAQAAVAADSLVARSKVSHQIVAAVRHLPPHAFVLLGVDHEFLGNPVSFLVNEPGGTPRFAVESQLPLSAVPPGPLYSLQVPGDPYRGQDRGSWLLTRLQATSGAALQARVTDARPGVLVLERAGAPRACRLVAGAAAQLRVTATGADVTCASVPVPKRWLARNNAFHRCTNDSCLAMGWFPDVASGAAPLTEWRRVATSVGRPLPSLLTDAAVVAEHGRGGLLLVASSAA